MVLATVFLQTVFTIMLATLLSKDMFPGTHLGYINLGALANLIFFNSVELNPQPGGALHTAVKHTTR